MQLTTTNGKEIYVNPQYIFKVEETDNGSLLTFEVEKFVLQDLQDVEVSQTPEELTEILKECLEVELLNSNIIYLNRKYIFKILEENDYTEIYVSIKDVTQKYRVYQVTNNVEDLISQIPSSGSGGNFLPLTGGTMDGNIDMNDNEIDNVDRINLTTSEADGSFITSDGLNNIGQWGKYYQNEAFETHYRYFNLWNGEYGDSDGKALSYSTSADLPEIIENGDFVHKKYVDDNFLPITGGIMQGNIDMAENAIENVPILTYIPDQNTGEERYFSLEELNFETLGEALTYSSNSDLPEIVNDFDIPHKAYVDSLLGGGSGGSDGDFLPLTGGTMTGAINMGDEQIFVNVLQSPENDNAFDIRQRVFFNLDNLPLGYFNEPVLSSELDIPHKAYVDNNFLPITGGAMEGAIHMGNEQIFVNLLEAENANALDIQQAIFNNENSEALAYVSEPEVLYPNDIPHKGYVDARTAGVPLIYATTFTTGADAEVKTITHNLNSTDVLLIPFRGANSAFKRPEFTILNTMQNVTLNSFEATFSADEQYKVLVLAFG